MKYCVIVLLLAGLWAGAGRADTLSPVIYSKTTLRILPHTEKKPTLLVNKDAKDKNTPEETASPSIALPTLPRIAKEFEVEVRPITFLSQHDFLAHQPFTDKEGMMVVLDPPQEIALASANLLATVDVLFVTEDGIITQIAPEISLRDITEPIESEKPLRAFIFLKAGMAKASDILPGDRVQNAFFRSHPVLLEAPSAPATK